MHSIRTKITLMTVSAVMTVMIVAAVLGVAAISYFGSRSADQILQLLGQSGQKNLDRYFESIEQSVEMVAAYVESDLDALDDVRLQAHLDRVAGIFRKLTDKTGGS